MTKKDATLIGIIAICAGILPLFLRGSYLFGFATLVGIFGIAAMAVDLVFGYAGQITLGHGAFMATGAYSSAILTIRYGFPPLAAMIVAAIFSGVIALAMGYPILGLLTHFHLAMATLAFGLLVYSFLVVGGEFTGGFSGIPDVPPFSIGPWVMKDELVYYFWVWFLALALLVVALNIGRSQAGRLLRAIQDDEIAAKAMGISVGAYKIKVLVVSAMFSSIAGSLIAHYISHVSPSQFDMGLSMDLLVMDVLGGKGTLVGGILGAAFLKFLPQLTEFFKDYRLLGNGIIVTLVLLFAPSGVIGLIEGPVLTGLGRRIPGLVRGGIRNRAPQAGSVSDPRCEQE